MHCNTVDNFMLDLKFKIDMIISYFVSPKGLISVHIQLGVNSLIFISFQQTIVNVVILYMLFLYGLEPVFKMWTNLQRRV